MSWRDDDRGGRGGGAGSRFRQEQTKMLKASVQTGHRTGLPKKMLDMFSPHPPLDYLKPLKKVRPKLPYLGVAQYVDMFAAPGDPEYEPEPPSTRPPSPRQFRNREFYTQARIDTESKIEKDKRITEWKQEQAQKNLAERVANYDAAKDPNIEGDPYKTLIVARLSYEVTEKKLRKEFEEFGPVVRVRVVHDKNTGKPRGYAFVEYEHKKDLKDAYKAADGRKIENRRILVDVERARTVENWRPRRLGGGLGGQSREPKEPKKKGVTGIAPPVDDTFDRRGGDMRGGGVDFRGGDPRDRRGDGGGRFDRGGGPPPRYDRGPPRDLDRDRERDRRGGDYGARDRAAPAGDYGKRPRDVSPRRDDRKRRHTDTDNDFGDRRERRRD